MSGSSTPTRHDRILGALLGVHAGDSLGATVEFESWEDIRGRFPDGVRDIIGGGILGWEPGHATDDTDLTRAVLLAYRDVRTFKPRGSGAYSTPPDVVKIAAQNMVDWYDGRWPGRPRGQRPVDVGGATATGLHRFKQTNDPRTSGAGQGRAGNGSLMRCIPTALFQPDADLALGESMAISAITHDDLDCTIACAAYNAVVRALVDGKPPEEAWQAGKAAVERAAVLAAASASGSSTESRQVTAQVSRAAEKVAAALDAGKTLVQVQDLAVNGPQNAANAAEVLPHRASGYVLESLILAVAALFDPRPLEEVLIDVVRFGKDTDTNGAIAGGLLGARDGVDAIPLRWREKLQFGREFAEVVEQMLSPQEDGTQGS
ncbi:hypothetical protein VTK26DRAFT_475 [Humicola hyalothermophila]